MSYQEPPSLSDEILTIESVKRYVKFIESIMSDDERAHFHEDALHLSVLSFISENKCENAQLCCLEAIKTQDLEFARWCS